MPRRPIFLPVLASLALLAAVQPTLAQSQLRSVVVPAEGGIIVPPRGTPRLAARPAGTLLPNTAATPPAAPVTLPATGTGLAAPIAGLILPAIAGALLGGSIAGSKGGGTSGPARTR